MINLLNYFSLSIIEFKKFKYTKNNNFFSYNYIINFLFIIFSK